MLRIEWDEASAPATLRLQGKLSGPWVEEVERVWATVRTISSHPIVDLTEVTFIAAQGRQLLAAMLRQGAELHGTLLMQFTIERIKLESLETRN